jgi:hypothetical protein
MADPTLEQETLEAFAVVEEVSDQLVRFGVGAQAITNRLAAESVFSVNAGVRRGSGSRSRNRCHVHNER